MRDRLIPMLILATALTAAYRAGGRASDRIADLGRSVLTRYELQSVRRILVGLYAYGSELPPSGDPDQLEALLRDESGRGRRDLTSDPWGQPYELDALGGDDYLLRSLGPNQERDAACDEQRVGGSGGGDPEGLLQRLRRRGGRVGPPPPRGPPAPPGVGGGGGAGVGPGGGWRPGGRGGGGVGRPPPDGDTQDEEFEPEPEPAPRDDDICLRFAIRRR